MHSQNRAISKVQLPAALPIGFTGHRNLPDEAKSRQVICDLLREKKRSIAAKIYGVSSVASGGDLLFAETCIELGIPLRVLLPAPKKKFREDFDKGTWLRAEHVLEKAMSVEVTEVGDSGEERYYHCSIETVRHSQLMIALWDGEPSHGLGGTSDTVSLAEKLGRPVIWVHSVTGVVTTINEVALQKLSDDPELEFLNQLPDAGAVVRTDCPKDLADGWFRKVDKNATRFAPQARRLGSIPILYTAIAAVLSGAASRGTLGGLWLVASAVMGITSAILPAILRLKERQAKWARTRTAAEVCRGVMALWNAPCSFEVVRPETLPELAGMLAALNRLKMLDSAQHRISVTEFKENYRKDRLDHQIRYFDTYMKKAAQHARMFRVITLVCAGLAVILTIWLFVSGQKTFGELSHSATRWLGLAASALFQVATVSGALLILNDAIRRHHRYQQMHGWLGELARQLDVVSTWHSVLGVVDRIERILLVELMEWKALTQNIELPRR